MNMPPPTRTEPLQAVRGVHLQYSAARLTRLFLTVAASLWIVHILLHLVAVATGIDRLEVYVFDLGAEHNLPTLYSTVALLVVAGLLFVTARHSKADRGYWWVLGFAFVFLACDETLSLHEKLVNPLEARFHTSGVFHYAWVIPYGIASLVFGLAFLRFLLRLPRKTAWRFVIGGAVFVMGGIGMEMVGGALVERGAAGHWSYWVEQTVEEVLEMTGVLVFLFGLGDYLDSHLGGLTIRLGSAAEAPSDTRAPATEEPSLAQPPAMARPRRPDVAS